MNPTGDTVLTTVVLCEMMSLGFQKNYAVRFPEVKEHSDDGKQLLN